MTRTTDTLKVACVAFATLALASMLFLPGRSSAASVRKAIPAMDAGGDFKAKCAACHGQDGSGNTPAGKNMKVKDLRSGEVQGMSDGDIFNAIANGKGKMQGYLKSLGADKCKQLAAYVKQFK
jgi:mono/diheme cytochrome c family protein